MSMQRQYQPGDSPVPGYRLLEHVGSGGLGDVWKAEAAGGAEVALKIVAGLGTAALKELRALELVKNIRHPNLVAIHGIWLKDEQGELLDDNWIATETKSGRVKVKVHPPDASSTTIFGEPGSSSDNNATDRKQPRELGETRLATPEPRKVESIDNAVSADSPTREIKSSGSPVETESSFEAELLLAMDLGQESLFDRMTRYKEQGLTGIPRDEMLGYLTDAAKAIDLMNRVHGIQHGDIKPKNLIVAGGAVQVCDFGLAQMLGEHRHKKATAFTVAYAAPEVITLQRPSPATDQYCLAISYYELRTGELPFASDTVKGVIQEKQQGDLKLDGLPIDERRIIAKAASLLPEARFSSCGAMVSALEHAIEALSNRPESIRTAPTGFSKPKAALVGMALLLLCAIGLYWLRDSANRDFRRALAGYQASESVFNSELTAATEALEHLDHGGPYEQAERELVDAWKHHTGDGSKLARPEFLATTVRFLDQQYEQSSAGGLRLAILGELVGQANDYLAADKLDDAHLIFRTTAEYMSEHSADAVTWIRRTNQLGLARIAARGSPGDTQSLQDELSKIPELRNTDQPDLTDFPPGDRAPAIVLLALTKRDQGYTQLLPLLFELISPGNLLRHLTDWERTELAKLKDRTRGEVESREELEEPWRSMADALWPNLKNATR